MRRTAFIFYILILLQIPGELIYGQSTESVDSINFSILTCGPGDQLYSLFGHSALRVQDLVTKNDLVYNWGTFDFTSPGFGIKFLRGKLPYALSVSSIQGFMQEYYVDQRFVKEQALNLTREQKQKLIVALALNAKEENRYYSYDFYFDNCTTRIKELLESIAGPIDYGATDKTESTFRNLLHENLTDHPWTKFGMDIILGPLSDQNAAQDGQMFLPEYYFNYMDRSENSDKILVAGTRTLLENIDQTTKQFWLSPTSLFAIFLAIEMLGFFLFYISGDRGFLKLYDRLWFIGLSAASIVFLFMWMATDHEVCSKNWNILWAGPWVLLYFNQNKFLRRTCFILTIVGGLILITGGFYLPQQFHGATLLIAAVGIIKSARQLGIVKWIDGWRRKSVVTVFILFSLGLSAQQKIGGITLVAPPQPFASNPFLEIKEVNAEWVALVPFAYSLKNKPEVKFGSSRQWWGERIEGIEATLALARLNDIKVMLKPQVWIPGGWVGEVDFDTEAEWKIWEESFQSYIMIFVDLASKYNVELFCIGTEYRKSVKKREAFWRQLIQNIRTKFKGKLTYSANWDSYEDIPFWDALDHIGISAYFPLSEKETPSEVLLSYKWKKHVRRLESFSKLHGKTILFTEFGYLSVDGAAGKTWELEKNINSRPINETAQANGYQALLKVFSKTEFWEGGFLWKWFPEGKGHEGYPERDYTPQNKLAQAVIGKWYRSFQ